LENSRLDKVRHGPSKPIGGGIQNADCISFLKDGSNCKHEDAEMGGGFVGGKQCRWAKAPVRNKDRRRCVNRKKGRREVRKKREMGKFREGGA